MNECIEDYVDAQDMRKEFHYSWIILLLAMMVWRHPSKRDYEPTAIEFFLAP